ncbi:MAG TPA: exodeoxyribonuclease V subunit gamma [Chitinophaga sp.]|uniref:exodeoxyribonuclease V subunit gamma n=1 Tax=Chitinophaga sp. TaxID=1869181 RepID=UPI002B8FBBAF|nr:exodeoxyribonuclease V subunit gamma [Chitinophaga sp.]HVI46720.1 exodeoxyribonuclease V subunit gamma [Chitinophaga sp.]
MSLYLKVSNSLNSLAAGLSEDLEQAGNGVFQSHYIVTQTEGMNNWLKLQLAHRLGIAANCRFMKPNDLLYHIYMLLGGAYTEVLSPQNLSWLLYKLMGETAFISRFPSVADYYTGTGPDSDLKRMGLAEKVADLFDQYQVYRPDMIREWSNHSNGYTQQAEWQEWLWIKVKQLSGDALPDKTIVGNYILETLRHKGAEMGLSKKIPAIHLFGLSIITAYHVKILHELSAYIDVHFHIINPAPEVFWFEDRSEKQLARWRQREGRIPENTNAGNALLTGWGKVIQNSFGLFFEYDAFFNAYEEIGIVPPAPDTLLHKIQHDIFSAATTDRNPVTEEDIHDGTVTINSCYTIAREVEVLYNYLVHLIDQKQEALSPRDIVVMVSDIDAYAPYIKAVFNNAPYKFRYTIADESYTDNDNLFNALQAVLHMNEDNFTAETVMQLLDFSYIRNRFSLNDPIRIRSIVQAANIRFGIDGRQEDETRFVSWRYGIQRIMYGICMSGEEEYGAGADSFYPLDILEGSDAHEIIRFCHFVEVLIASIEERHYTRSIADWVVYAERVLHNLVFEPQEDDDIDEDYTTLIKELSDYNALNKYMHDKVTFDVFSHSLLQTLTGTIRSGLFVNGGITFCSLIPMRSIPFKVVALMGLNYDKFPRREIRSSFNIMEQKRQRGDRNIKENDKHLFLETVMSAQQYLYISYIGRDVKDNTLLPPSALVDELIDYIESGTAAGHGIRKHLVTQHPMQGFSRKYGQPDYRLYSYLHTNSSLRKDIIHKEKVADPLNFEEITLNDLVSFFKNPFKAYYNKVLGIYYSDEHILLSETELFHLNKLEKWQLKNNLLPVKEAEVSALQNSLVKKGQLPLGSMAYVAIQEQEAEVSPVRSLYDACTHGAPEQKVAIELPIGDVMLKGNINKIFNGHLIQITWSKNEMKYLVEAYIRYLAAVAAGATEGMYFISGVEKKTVFKATPLSRETAHSRLSELVKIYKSGFVNVLPFYPSFGITPDKVETLDKEEFDKLITKNFETQHSVSDPYILQEYEAGYFEEDELYAIYRQACRLLITPLTEIFPEYFDKTAAAND